MAPSVSPVSSAPAIPVTEEKSKKELRLAEREAKKGDPKDKPAPTTTAGLEGYVELESGTRTFTLDYADGYNQFKAWEPSFDIGAQYRIGHHWLFQPILQAEVGGSFMFASREMTDSYAAQGDCTQSYGGVELCGAAVNYTDLTEANVDHYSAHLQLGAGVSVYRGLLDVVGGANGQLLFFTENATAPMDIYDAAGNFQANIEGNQPVGQPLGDKRPLSPVLDLTFTPKIALANLPKDHGTLFLGLAWNHTVAGSTTYEYTSSTAYDGGGESFVEQDETPLSGDRFSVNLTYALGKGREVTVGNLAAKAWNAITHKKEKKDESAPTTSAAPKAPATPVTFTEASVLESLTTKAKAQGLADAKTLLNKCLIKALSIDEATQIITVTYTNGKIYKLESTSALDQQIANALACPAGDCLVTTGAPATEKTGFRIFGWQPFKKKEKAAE